MPEPTQNAGRKYETAESTNPAPSQQNRPGPRTAEIRRDVPGAIDQIHEAPNPTRPPQSMGDCAEFRPTGRDFRCISLVRRIAGQMADPRTAELCQDSLKNPIRPTADPWGVEFPHIAPCKWRFRSISAERAGIRFNTPFAADPAGRLTHAVRNSALRRA